LADSASLAVIQLFLDFFSIQIAPHLNVTREQCVTTLDNIYIHYAGPNINQSNNIAGIHIMILSNEFCTAKASTSTIDNCIPASLNTAT
jgi:hypothetical protein